MGRGSAEDEFTDLYEREAPRLVRTVVLATREPALAEEAVAEAFARAWARWPQVRRHDRPAAWVTRVALNEIASRFRRRAVERRKAHAVARPELAPDPDPAGGADVWDAVATLPDQERTLVALRYAADLTQPQIAEVLDLSIGTVASGLHRARRRLGAALGPAYDEEVS